MIAADHDAELEELANRLDVLLARADHRLTAEYPGAAATRQPVHTVYVGADDYAEKLVSEWRSAALDSLELYRAEAGRVAESLGYEGEAAEALLARVRAKLTDEPVEDLRIDFEDGFGVRADAEEDQAVLRAVGDLVASRSSAEERTATYGFRIKSFEPQTRRRGLRTLNLIVAELARRNAIEDGFVITLAKASFVEHVEALVVACEHLERVHALAEGTLKFELQIETTPAVYDVDGTLPLARMLRAAKGRCTGLPHGTYDYSAACGISAGDQSMEHPANDHAKTVMQVIAAGTGVTLADGSTNVLPVGSADDVHRAWLLHARLVARSLRRGYYQGWDLHPAQLVTRYLATFGFFRSGFDEAAARLAAYLGTGHDQGVSDEPATATAMAGFLTRGLECGALTEGEVRERSGADRPTLLRLAKRVSTT